MLPFQLVKTLVEPEIEKKTFFLGPAFAEQLGLDLKGNLPVNLHLSTGRSRMISGRAIMDWRLDGLGLHASVLSSLALKSGRRYGFSYQNGVLRLGPVFGIMADVEAGSRRLFGNQDSFIRNLILHGQSLGEVCFAFSPYSINWQHKSIDGYTWSKGGWQKKNFPLPDVIYYRGADYANGKKNIRRKLEAQGCRFVNPLPVDKWKAHRILAHNHELARYLPETLLVNDFRQVQSMLKRHHAVYLKPVYGSKGQNIIRITRNKNKSSKIYQYQHSSLDHSISFRSMDALQSQISPQLRKRRYLIQNRINLIKSSGRIIDIRALVQKDHTGEWDITGLACRMGGAGSITSNLSAGGQGHKLEHVLQGHFLDEKQQEMIGKEIRYLALSVVRNLEQTMGPAGEMGIDIGVDQQGDIWFIEANLRPARRIFIVIGEKELRIQSIEKPLTYARYLAGFTSEYRASDGLI
ncbi:MAG TPA: YheC/YheD family protein [Syntrophomonadaceae bacterium]|nr:YheC/YheD family protein [Syntrophomonadaceae bacterium]